MASRHIPGDKVVIFLCIVCVCLRMRDKSCLVSTLVCFCFLAMFKQIMTAFLAVYGVKHFVNVDCCAVLMTSLYLLQFIIKLVATAHIRSKLPVGACIVFSKLFLFSNTLVCIYIYIYMCVCVCS